MIKEPNKYVLEVFSVFNRLIPNGWADKWYTKDEWLNALEKNNIKNKGWLNKNKNGSYSLKYCVDEQLEKLLKTGKITKLEYAEVLDQYNEKYKEWHPNNDEENFIPKIDECFIETDKIFEKICYILSNKLFFPIYIYGISGIGKTLQIEQACARNNIPFFRVQITKDTTNEDLIGSYSLVDGNTVWVDGPALKAYKLGATLLLDEVDLNPTLMILQGILEKKPIYVPQTGKIVYPKLGFQVFATGNSKGDGSEYEYVGTSALNKAFLERFDWIIEQKIPSIAFEKKIINKYIKINKIEIKPELLSAFIKWIDTVRKSYLNGDTTIYISSRRVQSILKGYTVLQNFEEALTNAISFYNIEEVQAFINVWKAIYNQNDDVKGEKKENENI